MPLEKKIFDRQMFRNAQFLKGELGKKNVNLGVGIFQTFYRTSTFYKSLMVLGLGKEVKKKTIVLIANVHNPPLHSIARHVELFQI
jgi:hypothetical protein